MKERNQLQNNENQLKLQKVIDYCRYTKNLSAQMLVLLLINAYFI
jgi:hypothetical protein